MLRVLLRGGIKVCEGACKTTFSQTIPIPQGWVQCGHTGVEGTLQSVAGMPVFHICTSWCSEPSLWGLGLAPMEACVGVPRAQFRADLHSLSSTDFPTAACQSEWVHQIKICLPFRIRGFQSRIMVLNCI